MKRKRIPCTTSTDPKNRVIELIPEKKRIEKNKLYILKELEENPFTTTTIENVRPNQK